MESNPHFDFHRKPDLLQRVIHGLIGAFFGGLIGLSVGIYLDNYLLWSVGISAAICFLVAFALGDRAVERILKVWWWA